MTKADLDVGAADAVLGVVTMLLRHAAALMDSRKPRLLHPKDPNPSMSAGGLNALALELVAQRREAALVPMRRP